MTSVSFRAERLGSPDWARIGFLRAGKNASVLYHPPRKMDRAVLVALVALLFGCQDDPEGSASCDYLTEELDWDDVADAPEFSTTPRVVADALALPLGGELEYLAVNTSDVVEATPSEGSTSFSSTLSAVGTPRLIHVSGARGAELLRCPSTLEFDATIEFRTDDGFFEESWSATVVASPGNLSASVDLDPDITGASEAFRLTPVPGAEPWETAAYRHRLQYGYCNGCDNLLMSGEISYRGEYAATMDGDIIDQRGFTVSLATWSGEAQ